MNFHPTSLPGVWRIDLEPRADERGHFTRTYCEREFAAHHLNTRWPQSNTTLTRRRGTLRGLHYQADPHPEIKLVRCTAGTVWDVVLHLATGKWEAFELSAAVPRQLYIPGGFAHGFQCLTDNCELVYQMSEFYFPDLARGVRYNDPALAIPWPVPNPLVSTRDQQLPTLADQ
jgi:dTDP-4-dehydrorhamnose 3,5-epimerase